MAEKGKEKKKKEEEKERLKNERKERREKNLIGSLNPLTYIVSIKLKRETIREDWDKAVDTVD